MSFSQSVKEEVFKNVQKLKGCCATSFLTAVLKSIGSLCLDENGYCFSVETDNLALLDFCGNLCQNKFATDCAIYQIGEDGSKNARYVGKFPASLGEKLRLTYRDDEGFFRIADEVFVNLQNHCCRRSFVQALFLSCGSATIPNVANDTFAESDHSNYHLELRFSNWDFAEFVLKTFAELEFRQTQRKNNAVLYIKDSEKISDFFVFVDAVNAKFTLENVLIGRSYRNAANRQRNCIDSNIDRAVSAAVKQLEVIAKIRNAGKFDVLPQQLKEVAVAREQNPSANLAELAAILRISKSGVNHRLAKLTEFAEK